MTFTFSLISLAISATLYASGIMLVVAVMPTTSGSNFFILSFTSSNVSSSAIESTIMTSCSSLTIEARYARLRGGPVVPTTLFMALSVGGETSSIFMPLPPFSSFF